MNEASMRRRPRRGRFAVALAATLAPALFLFPSTSRSVEPARLDLDACVAEAIAASPALEGARRALASEQALADRARADRWPVVGIDASSGWTSAVNEVTLPLAPPRSIRFGEDFRHEASVGIEVPVWTGGRLVATERAGRAAADAAGWDVAADSLQIVRDVRDAFYRALGAEAGADAAALAVRRLERHLDELRGTIAAGAATEETELQAEARLRAAESRRLAASEAAAVARLQLGRAIGRPGQAVAPAGDLARALLPVGPDGSLSFEGRPELRSVDRRQAAADQRLRVTRSAYLPTIAAGGRLHVGRPGVRITENEWMDWATAGVTLSWRLWDGGVRAADVRRARESARALDARREALRLDLETALAVARERLRGAAERATKATERVDLERRRLGLVEGRTREGLGTETELLDTQDDLAEAEIELASARADVRLAEVALMYAAAR